MMEVNLILVSLLMMMVLVLRQAVQQQELMMEWNQLGKHLDLVEL